MFALSRYSLSETFTSKRWILRYTAVISPEGSNNVEVLDNRRAPGSPSRIEPPSVHAELASQVPHKLRRRTGDRLCVLAVDLIEAVAAPELRQRHEIGARGDGSSDSASAVTLFSSLSGVEDIWIAAALIFRPSIKLLLLAQLRLARLDRSLRRIPERSLQDVLSIEPRSPR